MSSGDTLALKFYGVESLKTNYHKLFIVDVLKAECINRQEEIYAFGKLLFCKIEVCGTVTMVQTNRKDDSSKRFYLSLDDGTAQIDSFVTLPDGEPSFVVGDICRIRAVIGQNKYGIRCLRSLYFETLSSINLFVSHLKRTAESSRYSISSWQPHLMHGFNSFKRFYPENSRPTDILHDLYKICKLLGKSIVSVSVESFTLSSIVNLILKLGLCQSIHRSVISVFVKDCLLLHNLIASEYDKCWIFYILNNNKGLLEDIIDTVRNLGSEESDSSLSCEKIHHVLLEKHPKYDFLSEENVKALLNHLECQNSGVISCSEYEFMYIPT